MLDLQKIKAAAPALSILEAAMIREIEILRQENESLRSAIEAIRKQLRSVFPEEENLK